MTVYIAKELSSTLHTKVEIGRINVGLLNRIILDDLLLDDQSDKEMLKVTRLSVKFDLIDLLSGRISISNVQLFGFNINLNKPTPDADSNFKFVLDAFASKDSVKTQSDIDLRINSLLVRRGKLAYDVLSEKETPGKFNPKHIKLYNIIGNISLKALQNDSINAQIKRLSLDEQSGFELQKLNMKILGNDNNLTIDNFAVNLPNTSLQMDTIHMNYDSLGAFRNFLTDVQFSLKIKPSHITLHDISPFVPVLEHFKEKIKLELRANGTIDQLNCPELTINSDNHLRVRGNVSLHDLSTPENAFIYGKLSYLSVNQDGIDFLVRNFSKEYSTTPDILKRLGNVSFTGEISGYFNDLVTYGTFQTGLGSVKSDVKVSSDKEKGIISYSGGVKTENFELGALLNNNKLGKITFDFNVKSNHQPKQYPYILLKGLVSSIEYSNYQYDNIELDGEYKQGGFDGKIALNDENGSVFLNGNINVAERVPTFDFNAIIKNVRPYELNIASDKYKDTNFSMKLTANFTGSTIDDMVGSIHMDSVSFIAPNDTLSIDKIRILSTRTDTKNILTLDSEFMNARVEGTYSYRTLPISIMNTIRRYVPAVFPPNGKKEIETSNNFSFDINIFNTKFLPIVFDIPLKVYTHSTFKGYFNDKANRMMLEGYIPQLQYGNMFLESGFILCENTSDYLRGRVRLSNHRKNSIVNLSLDTQAKDNVLDTQINWGNTGNITYSGKFAALTNFSRSGENKKSHLKTVIDVKQTDVILNDTIWKIHPSQIVADSGKVHINDFYFSHENQHLHIDGLASDNLTDTVKVDLKGINIEYVFDLLNFKSVDFKGHATGTAMACGVLKKPIMNTRLFVKDFYFNDGLMGDMNVTGEWHQEEEGIWVDAHIKERNISETLVKGYIFPLKPKSGLDLDIRTQNVDIRFLETYVKSLASDFSGRVSGKVRLYGTFKTLNLDGAGKPDATFKVNVLDTYFAVRDSVYLSPREVSFKNIPFYDIEGHRGAVNGYLRHQHFKDMNYRLDINTNNMLVMKTYEDAEVPFYGTVYATGNGLLRGNGEGLNIDAAITTNRNTTFVYTMSPTASAVSNQFIKFVDKTPNRTDLDFLSNISDFDRARQQQKKEEEELDIDVRLNLQIDATPDANMRIIMDPIAGDYIGGKGTGNVRIDFFNKGDIKMFGSYAINQGVYKFSLQEVIRKDFIIKDGSNIVFNGDPFDATMDVQAAYTVNSASLNDLLTSEETALIANVNVRVNCLMNLSGVLTNPTIKLNIELPNERDEVQALVRNYISTEEEINMQTLYLLGIGKFYPPEHLTTGQNSNVMSSVLSSTLSGQLNNLLSQIIDNNNWNIGTNLSTGDKGWTDVEVEGILSGQLLNNRLLINGNFGYRDNPMSTTNFVGDFDAEWLLTRSGDIRLKAYNQTNDRYYTRTNLTTQGIGIMYKKDFYKWNELFFWRNWRKKKQAKKVEVKERVAPLDTIPADSLHNQSTSWIQLR
ncbi:translocation/assembly module TamB domain-containing protein [Bacteroides sp. 224]|uniref:translocation/assembly module TamB domain-containing protein n=1 Tax=Bacteroides sp. 224 TaxID=2302936 RepID=UPI0013D11E8C|nr:translocation/assembly module TamB domain-containing protein [Bacteroides sp. 224]NDV64402.1 translocation/assembly module TamB [Bacteroides sp. 224]